MSPRSSGRQSNDRWSSCADGYYQANDNDTNVNDDDKRNNNDNPMADKGTVQMASTASSDMQQSFSTGGNLKTV